MLAADVVVGAVDAPVCCGVTPLRKGLVLGAAFVEAIGLVPLPCSSGERNGLCDVL